MRCVRDDLPKPDLVDAVRLALDTDDIESVGRRMVQNSVAVEG